MSNSIYLDPSAGTPSVIEIASACYVLAGPTSAPPDTDSYDSEFSDCTSCMAAQCNPPYPTMYTMNFTSGGVDYSVPITGPSDGCAWGGHVPSGPLAGLGVGVFFFEGAWQMTTDWGFIGGKSTGHDPTGAYNGTDPGFTNMSVS